MKSRRAYARRHFLNTDFNKNSIKKLKIMEIYYVYIM